MLNDVSGADAYEVQVATDPAFLDLVVGASGVAVSENNPPKLSINSRYFWHVRGSNSAGDGSWSSIFSFSMETDLIFADDFEP